MQDEDVRRDRLGPTPRQRAENVIRKLGIELDPAHVLGVWASDDAQYQGSARRSAELGDLGDALYRLDCFFGVIAMIRYGEATADGYLARIQGDSDQLLHGWTPAELDDAAKLFPVFSRMIASRVSVRWMKAVHQTTTEAHAPRRIAPRSRASRRRAPGRLHGSRRTGSRAGPDDGGGEPDPEPPPRLRLRRHPRYGLVNAVLLRLLQEADR
jgi:hypothetical protein